MESVHRRDVANGSWRVWALLAFCGIFRASLLGSGALSFPDEQLYSGSIRLARALATGGFAEALVSIADSWGRPGEVLLRLPEAVAQIGLLKLWGVPLLSPESLLLSTVFNVAYSLITLYFFYGISMAIIPGRQQSLALVATGTYAALINSNIYLRHILPYPHALGLTLAALMAWGTKTLQGQSPSPGRAILAGLLVGTAFTVYPGFYFLFLWVTIIAGTRGWKATCYYALGGAIPLATFTLIFYGAGLSYLNNLRELSQTILQGSFEDSISFPYQYLYDVEGPLGCAVGVGALLGAILFLSRRQLKKSLGEWLPEFSAGFVFLAWSIHSVQAYFMKSTVFYGRLMHQFFPLLVWGCFSMVSRREGWLKNGALALLLATCTVSIIRFSLSYSALGYPLDALHLYSLDRTSLPTNDWVDEVSNCHSYLPRSSAMDKSNHLKLVNFCFPYPPIQSNFTTFLPPSGMKELYSSPHFLGYLAYLYEGQTSTDRRFLIQNPLRLTIYTAD